MSEQIPTTTPDPSVELQRAVGDVFQVERVYFDPGPTRGIRLLGSFVTDPAEAYPVVAQRFDNLGYTAYFREQEGQQTILAVPGKLPEEPPNVRLAVILFALSFLSVFVANGIIYVDSTWTLEQRLVAGISSAITLMAILFAHEMGHYLVARRLNIPSTLPYFIPMPLSPLGTMGAFIRMKSPPQNRRHLLLLGLAGPVSGLILAIPLLIFGLSLSRVEPASPLGGALEGNSILYALVKIAYFGRFLPNCTPGAARSLLDILRTALQGCPVGVGEDVILHPLAFAAWAGILVTGLNLIPAGTLDGGHVAYALLGERARYLTYGLIVALALLGLRWWGWFIWAALIYFLGRIPAVPRNDVTRLKAWQVVVGILVMILFLMTFTPIPMGIIQ